VASIGRPEGNVTGVTSQSIEVIGKRLELLHELIPSAARIALLVNPNNPRLTQDVTRRSEAAARQLGLDIVLLKAGTVGEIESAIEAAVQQRAGALVIGNEAFLNTRARQIAFLGLRHALPTIGTLRQDVESGVLMSYGSNPLNSFRLAGGYVGRIIKGEKPADLPVVQPTQFELIINLTTAKTIGQQIPAKFLALADEVIE
jgi:putative ABC transport system substrate-binding protein